MINYFLNKIIHIDKINENFKKMKNEISNQSLKRIENKIRLQKKRDVKIIQNKMK